MDGLDLFGSRGGPSSVVHIMEDELQQCNVRGEGGVGGWGGVGVREWCSQRYGGYGKCGTWRCSMYVCAVQEVGWPCFMCACINVLFLSGCLLYALMLSVGMCVCMY